MSVTAEENALAERVVAKSRREARTDTGRLKDSINKKVQRGVIVFREYFYGAYPEGKGRKNSTLEENAKAMMGDVPYKIERLDEDGNTILEVNKATSGRVTTYERKKRIEKEQDTTRQLLIERRKRNAEAEKDDTSEDN